MPSEPVYVQLMQKLFERHSAETKHEFDWDRKELTEIAADLNLKVPKNIGDTIYAIRYGRNLLPDSITGFASPLHWLLLPNGKSKYRFVKARNGTFTSDTTLRAAKIPNSTPQIVDGYSGVDEQAVLARIRYNRLIDIFLGLNTFSLQSHLRTTVAHFNKSQIETDEIYVGVDRSGVQYVIPVQAKGMNETVGAVQAIQDIYCCKERFPDLVCRAISAKTVGVTKHSSGVDIYTISLMELGIDAGTPYDVSKISERHFQLALHSDVTVDDLRESRKNVV